ncbi:hypothetical protein DXG01_004080, partial [Tephrocybe rancida]
MSSITASTITSTALSYIKNALKSIPLREAAARAILRHDAHMSDHMKVENHNGLHRMYVELHSRGDLSGEELLECKAVLEDLQGDVLDAVTTLDRADGGMSILLRIPGFLSPDNLEAKALTVDVVVPPRERLEGGKDFSKAVAMLIQTFGCDLALPYLKRFQERCTAEGVVAPPPPSLFS